MLGAVSLEVAMLPNSRSKQNSAWYYSCLAPQSLHNHPAPPARLSLNSLGSAVLPVHRTSANLSFMPLIGQPLSNSVPHSHALKLSGLFDRVLKTSASIKSHPMHLPLLRLPLPPATTPKISSTPKITPWLYSFSPLQAKQPV